MPLSLLESITLSNVEMDVDFKVCWNYPGSMCGAQPSAKYWTK